MRSTLSSQVPHLHRAEPAHACWCSGFGGGCCLLGGPCCHAEPASVRRCSDGGDCLGLGGTLDCQVVPQVQAVEKGMPVLQSQVQEIVVPVPSVIPQVVLWNVGQPVGHTMMVEFGAESETPSLSAHGVNVKPQAPVVPVGHTETDEPVGNASWLYYDVHGADLVRPRSEPMVRMSSFRRLLCLLVILRLMSQVLSQLLERQLVIL